MNKKLKAQNTIELITLVSLVVVIVLAVFMFSSKQNQTLADNSAIMLKPVVANPTKTVSTTAEAPKKVAETAGALSSTVATMSTTEITNSLASTSKADILATKTSDNKDLVDLANELISELNLSVSPLSKNVSDATLKSALAKVATEAKTALNGSTSSTYDLYTSLLDQVI